MTNVNSNQATETKFSIGDRVESGAAGTDDHDTGRILEIAGAEATVGWDSGVRTTIAIEDLRPAK